MKINFGGDKCPGGNCPKKGSGRCHKKGGGRCHKKGGGKCPDGICTNTVGESPRREKNFGTSGYKIRRFVSEIWPFEVGIAVRTNSTCKI